MGSRGACLRFLKRPTRLDRIEVGGVRRQVQDADAMSSAERDDAPIFMSGEVVENECVPAI